MNEVYWYAPITIPLLLLLFLGSTLLLVGLLRQWWVARLWRTAARMHTVELGSVRLHYFPELQEQVSASRLADTCAEQLNLLAGWFGYRIRSLVSVYVLPSEVAVREVCGGYYGRALPFANLIAIPFGTPHDFRRIVRHLLTHLFVSRLRVAAPEFSTQGLAGFLSECADRSPGTVERWPAPPNNAPPLRSMLNRSVAPTLESDYYGAAANFTAFLIRRFGWSTYRVFYRRAHRWNYSRAFRRSFGIPLESAEVEWLSGA